jgi:hypothetical protein
MVPNVSVGIVMHGKIDVFIADQQPRNLARMDETTTTTLRLISGTIYLNSTESL